MNSSEIKLVPEAIKAALLNFWESNIEITERDGQILASLPLLYPDGMQVVISLKQITPAEVTISDLGRTVARLEGDGMDLSAQRNSELLSARAKAFELSRRGFEIYKTLPFPFEGMDIHLFGEALVSISHLIYRHEISVPRSHEIRDAVKGVLARNKFIFKEGDNAFVSGKIAGRIEVDFLTVGACPVACKAIDRKGRMRDYIEQWGFRWRDAMDCNPLLINSMFYDPDAQQWDSDSLNIGRNVCKIFEPYFEAEKISKALEPYLNGNHQK